jgi:hypothetical protein
LDFLCGFGCCLDKFVFWLIPFFLQFSIHISRASFSFRDTEWKLDAAKPENLVYIGGIGVDQKYRTKRAELDHTNAKTIIISLKSMQDYSRALINLIQSFKIVD